MLSSLPTITPRDSYDLWYTPSSTFSFAPPEPQRYTNYGSDAPPHHLSVSQQNQHLRTRTPRISPLAQLIQDEHSVSHRKLHIQRFGATWIRPPGMAKTYQGELDERAEREEAEAQEMMEDVEVPPGATFEEVDEDGEPLNAPEPDANIQERDLDDNVPEGDSFVDGADELDDEVDLDADIPEAEAETLWDDSDEDGEEEGDDYASSAQETSTLASTRDGSESVSGPNESPQQAMFSHDETYPDERRRPGGEVYGWRGRARYRQHADDGMEVDSDG